MACYQHVLAIFLATLATRTVANVPAIYIFGDSTVDVGNNNYLSDEAEKANFPHYGIDYPGGYPTGRFSNGLIGIDFTAQALGLQQSPPPFLSRPIGDIKFLRGVNFASGNSGILNITGVDVITMDEQIEYFKAVVAQLKRRKGKKAASQLLAESLVYISIGSNDLFALYDFTNPPNSTLKDEIVDILTIKFQEQLEVLYYLGARKFAVVGTGLLGCTPIIRVISPSFDCFQDLNDFSLRFSSATEDLLKYLSTEFEDFKYSFGDAYKFGVQVNNNPSLLGLTELDSACCGLGTLNAEVMCGPDTAYCDNRDTYYYWDRYHPSQTVYKIISGLFVDGQKQFVRPLNIGQLVQS